LITDGHPEHAVTSFAPIEGERATVLVLGSMPGTASLRAARYYAHPRNAFWPIMLAWLHGTGPDRLTAPAPSYEQRVLALRGAGIAVWDVLERCRRPGSLDSAIERDSERANDIASLVARHPELRRIVFNGRTAERLFARHVGPLDAPGAPTLYPAPSTSPAMASLTRADKHAAWCEALGPVPVRVPRPDDGA